MEFQSFESSMFFMIVCFCREGEKVMVENLRLRDGQEGIKAFIEKRPPHWSNSDENVH